MTINPFAVLSFMVLVIPMLAGLLAYLITKQLERWHLTKHIVMPKRNEIELIDDGYRRMMEMAATVSRDAVVQCLNAERSVTRLTALTTSQ